MRSDLPRHLLVVGGGYIGCEFASIFRSLGLTVTLVEKSGRLLPTWDEAVGDFIAEAMRLAGIELHLGFALDVSHLQQSSEQPAFILGDGGRITPDLVLAATGRKPNVEDLGLAAMEIVATPFIRVDEQMRTSCDRVFAVGDVNGLTLLDSAAVAQARVAVDKFAWRRRPQIRRSHRLHQFGKNVTGAKLKDRRTGKSENLGADLVVNATGPWAGEIAAMAGVSVPEVPTAGRALEC